jgi:hypothetical protein
MTDKKKPACNFVKNKLKCIDEGTEKCEKCSVPGRLTAVKAKLKYGEKSKN